MYFQVGNMKLRRYTRNILLRLLSCCVIFHLWSLLSEESNDIITDSIYVVSRSLAFATAADAYRLTCLLLQYISLELEENCSHSTHMSSLTIELTPFTVMQLVRGLSPDSFHPSLLLYILISYFIADWTVLLQGIRSGR